jgi:predicted AAA+ superfamily ATPase
VIGAGSLLEFELENISMPVGRIQFLYLYPLSFGEFLTSLGKDDLRAWLKDHPTQKAPEPIHQQLCTLLRDYVLIGGMPEVVMSFLETKDLKSCQAIQSTLLETFREDFHKYAKRREIKFLQLVFESVPRQLGRKFKFAHVSSDIKSRELGAALHLLENAGLVHKVYHTSANGMPLGGELDEKKFKVLFFDVGLALRLLDLSVRDLYLNNDLHLVNNGAITELLAGLEIVAHSPNDMRAHLYYWHRESKSANAEVDYVLAKNQRIIPVEVKHRVGGQLKSLWYFMKEKDSHYGVRMTQSPYEKQNEIETIPLYALEGFLKREAL